MKRLMMSLLLLGALPFTMAAQDDDMYFVPTKENQAKEALDYGMPSNTYYSGSSRSVDDYNHYIRSSVTPIDSTGNDIIDFSSLFVASTPILPTRRGRKTISTHVA